MTKLIQGFNPLQYDPAQGGGGFPIGKHPVVIKGSEVKPTSQNNGGMLVLTLEIIDGSSKGSSGEYRLNLYNQSPQACEIAHKQLSAICYVTNQFQLGSDGTDTTVLFNIPFIIEVGYQKGQEPGIEGAKGYTEIKKVYDINGNEPKAGQQQQAQQNQGFGTQQNNNFTQQQPQNNTGFGGNNAPANNNGANSWGGNNQQQEPQQQQQQQQPQQNTWAQNTNNGANGGPNTGGAAVPAWAQKK